MFLAKCNTLVNHLAKEIKMKTDNIPVLYILMRNDLDSMNPGKAMAQASHASNAFVKSYVLKGDDLYKQWEKETPQGFGTVLVLAVNELEMTQAVRVARACKFPAAVIHDPTYPVQDGEVTWHIPVDTCAYVFGEKDDLMLTAILQNFPLHD